MRKVILTSHGKLAEGLKMSVEMIVGKNENLYAVSMLEGESPILIVEKVNEIISENEHDEIIILTDFPGGSINNNMMNYLNQERVQVVSGMNLMLVMEMLLSQESNINKVISAAIESAISTISNMRMIKCEEKEEDLFL